MVPYGVVVAFTTLSLAICIGATCLQPQSETFVRWPGVAPEVATPVFVYSASGAEESLAGACLQQCLLVPECGAVIIASNKGSCQGTVTMPSTEFRADNDIVYFTKVCLQLPESCSKRWWSVESSPGHFLNSEDTHTKVLLNTTVGQCYSQMFSTNEKLYRSAQWMNPSSPSETFVLSDSAVGNCILNTENKFTEPESYRLSNYYTFYMENQCSHDYQKKIDRCSYEEYYNQTIKHVDLTAHNYTKDECKSACEVENRFVCRGFTWSASSSRGLCDLHSEDLVATGSWLLRRLSDATYYRRVICLNISVECEGPHLVVTYTPRARFRGRVHVPGRGEHCGARSLAPLAPLRLALPLHGDCDVNFAYAITKGPNGIVNRTMAYVLLMIQNNPIIQTAGDRWVRVGCSPGAGVRGRSRMHAAVAVQAAGRPSLASEQSAEGASAVFGAGAAPLSMYVARAHAAGALAAALGEPLELRIETTEESEIEAYHLVASSRLGDSSVLLIDGRGCPTGQVDFPSFARSRLGGTQRLSARFKAFRFPTSHVVRFAIMIRFCEEKCLPINCETMEQMRSARQINDTFEVFDSNIGLTLNQDVAWSPQVVAQGGRAACAGADGRVPLELEMVVGSRDILSADTLIRAEHRSVPLDDVKPSESAMVCVHELLLVALLLIWLVVQVLLLLGCCVLVKRYRNLAEMGMQKDYHSFDNVGFDTVSTHRRVHWPDQNIDIIHAS